MILLRCAMHELLSRISGSSRPLTAQSTRTRARASYRAQSRLRAPVTGNVRRQMGAYMSQKQQIWWGKVRRQGMLRFVLLYGVLGWGGLSAATWMAWMWFTATKEYFVRTFFSQSLFFVLVVVFSGLMFGFLLWHVNEIGYKRALEDQAHDK